MGEEMHSLHSSLTDLRSFKLTTRVDSPYTPHKVDKVKRHLKFYFMTPCEKFKARRRKPWKLSVQIFKIIIVTIQVFILGTERTEFVDYSQKTKLALEHIMFKGWDFSYETMPYPPATGQYALYKQKDLEDHINHAMMMYNRTPELAIGAYGYPESVKHLTSKPAHLKLEKYKVAAIFPGNGTYDLNPIVETDYYNLTAVTSDNETERYDVVEFLKRRGAQLSVHQLRLIELSFPLNGIHIKPFNPLSLLGKPDCLRINATAVYDNIDHDGQMIVQMRIELMKRSCQKDSTYEKDSRLRLAAETLLDVLVILFCIMSFLSCVRSLKKSLKLLRKCEKFFHKHYDYTFTWEDTMLFVSLWFCMIIISDVLTVVGTGFKMALTFYDYEYYDEATMLLGIAIILIWMGVMRYFEYFQKYNMLVLTCKRALPDVIRFLICASIFYVAFTICGWLVLGPYHLKFSSIATSSECLFSLVNGDDMFVTFSVIDGSSPSAIWYFSRVYLYSFISLFIYFVLNLFTSVIIDTYEVVKSYRNGELPKSVVEEFADSCVDDPTSPLYASDVQHRGCSISACCCLWPCCHRERNDDFTNILA